MGSCPRFLRQRIGELVLCPRFHRTMIILRTFARRPPMMKTMTAILLIALSPVLACAGRVQPRSAGPAGLPPGLTAEPATAVVTSTVENMHRGSSADSDVVSQAILGTNVKLLKKERNAGGEDWYEVETPDAYKGWIIASALRLLGPGEKPYGVVRQGVRRFLPPGQHLPRGQRHQAQARQGRPHQRRPRDGRRAGRALARGRGSLAARTPGSSGAKARSARLPGSGRGGRSRSW